MKIYKFAIITLTILAISIQAKSEVNNYDFETQKQVRNWIGFEKMNIPISCSNKSELEMINTKRVILKNGKQISRVGGDYWQLPLKLIGNEGDCRLDTWYRKKDNITLISPNFKIKQNYLSFLLNGGGSEKTSFELQVKSNEKWKTVKFENGDGTYPMQRFNWEISDYLGEMARLRINDFSNKLKLSDLVKTRIKQIEKLVKNRNKKCEIYSEQKEKNSKFVECLENWQIKIDQIVETSISNSVPWIGIDDIKLSSIKIMDNKQPIWGASDLHLHLFAEHNYGGGIHHGKFAGKISDSLKHCEDHGRIPEALLGHDPSGYPSFKGWPTIKTLTHQQAHSDWLYRSWQGGLRLIMMDVVNNEFMRDVYDRINTNNNQTHPDDDETAIKLQVESTKKWLKDYKIDWAEIAYTPEDARRIAGKGNLAIILGVEVDNLAKSAVLKSKKEGKSLRKALKEYISYLNELGIKHIFPIHLMNNQFGGMSVFNKIFDLQSQHFLGEKLELREGWERNIRYRFDQDYNLNNQITEMVMGLSKRKYSSIELNYKSHINRVGLTNLGEVFIEELMKAGMLIDLDHMSDLAKDKTIAIAERYNYPLMASHSRVREITYGSKEQIPFMNENDVHKIYGTSTPNKLTTERSLSNHQLAYIKKSSGVVGLNLGSKDVNQKYSKNVSYDCDGSSKAYVQPYSYINDLLDGKGIAFGSDLNGFGGIASPRFGENACYEASKDNMRKGLRNKQISEQSNPVTYFETLEKISKYNLSSKINQNKPLLSQISGYREFDYNTDGMIHIGLLPDFWQDLSNIGMSKKELSSLFNSAEYVIQMWEKAEEKAKLIKSK